MNKHQCQWDSPPKKLNLLATDVHVWRASLDMPPLTVQNLRHTLSDDEKKRADRFVFEKHRKHFIVARGTLRTLLSLYLNIPPKQLQFTYTNYGKPALASNLNPHNLNFNLSHSGTWVLYAFSYHRELGIDIEHIRQDIEHEDIAKNFFSATEKAALNALPTTTKAEAFFNCWTRKEAYIKAIGQGLSMPLDQFDVSLTPSQPAQLLATRHITEDAARWSLIALNPAPNYKAALVVEGHEWQLTCWQWDRS